EVKALEPVAVLDTPNYGNVPAQKMLEKYKIMNQSQREQLEKIKEELYKLSFYTATYNEKYKDFFSKNLHGKKVAEGKNLIKEEIIARNWGAKFFVLPEKVVSRALNECVVKIVNDQWFIDYGNEKWKKEAHECLAHLKLYPEKARQQFAYVIDW